MKSYSFQSNTPKPFYPRNDFDLESGPINKRSKKHRNPLLKMVKSVFKSVHHFSKSHPFKALFFSLSIGFSILIILTLYESQFRVITTDSYMNYDSEKYPFSKMKNLVMVAGHSVYTSSRCEKVEREESWFLESYQKNPGQAATFLSHIKEGVAIADKDDVALLLFSGGETRKEAGPRSEAQSYWTVAESRGWFGKQESVKWRALTEEHARDSFENLLFSVCRFRELTGAYPQNITVVSYDFKEERFADLHRSAIRFPEERFHYAGTPASPSSKEAAIKGESMVRSQFQMDPYGCLGSLRRKKLGRDPFRRTIPYPNGCPDIQGLFRYCDTFTVARSCERDVGYFNVFTLAVS